MRQRGFIVITNEARNIGETVELPLWFHQIEIYNSEGQRIGSVTKPAPEEEED
jgi:hypothetical protein